jgi:hypothetical protein
LVALQAPKPWVLAVRQLEVQPALLVQPELVALNLEQKYLGE